MKDMLVNKSNEMNSEQKISVLLIAEDRNEAIRIRDALSDGIRSF